MLRVGLTGGIGSGKSTVSKRLAALGAIIVDADRIAREVVEPGTPALAAIRERFGPAVLDQAGGLDRPALGRVVFGDPQALRDLEAITHPAIWATTAARIAAAPPEAIVVHDMPLLVEKGMAGEYHLVIVVGASEAIRLHRLNTYRGMPEADARARIAAQATDEARHAAADVWLPNEGTPAVLENAVTRLWHERLVPFADNARRGIRSRLRVPTLSPPDPTWPEQAARLIARVRHAGGEWIVAVEHIGSTAVPDFAAKDVIDLQVGVRTLADADAPDFVAALTRAGFVLVPENRRDNGKDGAVWAKRFYGSADPGRVVHVHVREVGSPGWAFALDFRNWLRAVPEARAEYAAVKATESARHTDSGAYADAKEPWFDDAYPRVRAWAAAHGRAQRPGEGAGQ